MIDINQFYFISIKYINIQLTIGSKVNDFNSYNIRSLLCNINKDFEIKSNSENNDNVFLLPLKTSKISYFLKFVGHKSNIKTT